MSTNSIYHRNNNKGNILKEIEKLNKKLNKTRDVEARNKLITQLNTFLRLTGSKIKYQKE